MASSQPLSYWKKYRNIRNKVNEHVLAVHQTNVGNDLEVQHVPLSSDDSDNERRTSDFSNYNSPNGNPQTLQLAQETSQSFQDTVVRENSKISGLSGEHDYGVNGEHFSVENEMYFETIPSSDSSSESETDENDDLALHMTEWATEPGASHASINELLCILRPCHVCLPKDARPLLKLQRYMISLILQVALTTILVFLIMWDISFHHYVNLLKA